jgi:signal transduction histidine kinase/HAMP domain-containing protein
MRGGLGRTLLTAFLILTILPLAVIGSYAARQNQRNLEDQVTTRLLSISTLKADAFAQWLETLESVVGTSLIEAGPSYDRWWARLQAQIPEVQGVVVLDANRQPLYAVEDNAAGCKKTAFSFIEARHPGSVEGLILHSSPSSIATIGVTDHVRGLAAIVCFTPASVRDILHSGSGIGETGHVALVSDDGQIWPGGEDCLMPGLAGAAGEELGSSSDRYVNASGNRVMGAYHRIPDRNEGVLVEQHEAEVVSSTENMAATLIAMVLAVALATTAIAAVVIRQITRPVIDLTESAVAMAEGELDQHLNVRSRDEIGILTYVFNEMAADLKSLYEDLEAKVVERTRRLQRANYQIQRRALHLEASQDVSQVVTSIRDPEVILSRVTELILQRFFYSSVAIYRVDPGGGEARLQAVSPDLDNDENGTEVSKRWATHYRLGDGSVVAGAIRTGVPQVHNEPGSQAGGYERTLSLVAIPLKMEARRIGAIAVATMAHEEIQQDELHVLETLANQVAIALENAHAYERERIAMMHMEAAEAFKARFLSNMSHELREPLNTTIGFSRVLLKGIDGPLNSRQRQDVEQIYEGSQNLLGLINDILAISQLQAGLMELRLQPVQLTDLVEAVLPTASALVRGKDVEFETDVPDELPRLRADPDRLRQVLVHLLNNAAKFTDLGTITLRARADDGHVFVSVNDTGVGIPQEDRERIFAEFEKGNGNPPGVGLGLALCKEFIELHGGNIWVDSEVGVGSTFTFSLPIYAEADSPEAISVPLSQERIAQN